MSKRTETQKAYSTYQIKKFITTFLDLTESYDSCYYFNDSQGSAWRIRLTASTWRVERLTRSGIWVCPFTYHSIYSSYYQRTLINVYQRITGKRIDLKPNTAVIFGGFSHTECANLKNV